MEIEEINEDKLEIEQVNLLEHINGLEGIFLDFGGTQDALQLIESYDKYLEIGFNGEAYDSIPSKKSDMIRYFSLSYEKRINFREYLQKKWNY